MINTQQVNMINYIVACISEFAARFDISSKEAFNYLKQVCRNKVYNSTTYEKLTNFDTGLYRESSAYMYELLKDELKEGKLIQKEI